MIPCLLFSAVVYLFVVEKIEWCCLLCSADGYNDFYLPTKFLPTIVSRRQFDYELVADQSLTIDLELKDAKGNSAAGCTNPLAITVTVTNENDNAPLCDPTAFYASLADGRAAGTINISSDYTLEFSTFAHQLCSSLPYQFEPQGRHFSWSLFFFKKKIKNTMRFFCAFISTIWGFALEWIWKFLRYLNEKKMIFMCFLMIFHIMKLKS